MRWLIGLLGSFMKWVFLKTGIFTENKYNETDSLSFGFVIFCFLILLLLLYYGGRRY